MVNKPSTVAMHPCGAYRFNSLFHIVDAERKAAQDGHSNAMSEVLHVVHRLDRLTSGLTLFAKTPEVERRALRLPGSLLSEISRKYPTNSSSGC